MHIRGWIATFGAAAIVIGLSACGAPSDSGNSAPLAGSADTMEGGLHAESPVAETNPAQEKASPAVGQGHLEGLSPVASLSSDFWWGYTTFAMRLLRQMSAQGEGEENLFVSPASVYLALGMAANGAAGNTATQMLGTLGMPGVAALNAGCLDLQAVLLGNEQDSFRLANGLWLDEGLFSKMKPEFLEANRRFFGANAEIAAINEVLVGRINQWVADNTADRIQDLLGEESADASAILVNTLLFEAGWKHPFSESRTVQGVFHGAARDVELPMMHQELKSPVWYEDDQVQATRLRFADERTSMLVVLPKRRGAQALRDWVAQLDADGVQTLLDATGNIGELRLTMPRFTLSYRQDMTAALQAMGMVDAFDPDKANFLSMASPPEGLCIGRVDHCTKLEVSESGVLAAAATGVGIFTTAAQTPDTVKTLTLDRPFFCAIMDEPTDAILFGGVVMQPET